MKIEAEKLRLYAVTDRSWLKEGETLAGVLEEMLDAGVTCVQLREKTLDDAAFLSEAKAIGALCRRYGVPFIVNDRPDIAKEAGADGVHVGLSDMGIEKARAYLGDGFIIGGSAHNVQEALAAYLKTAVYGYYHPPKEYLEATDCKPYCSQWCSRLAAIAAIPVSLPFG